MLKRLFDIVAAGLALVVLSPILCMVGGAVRLTSPGPVFYRQTRVGRGRGLFKIVKFRSMVTDAEDSEPLVTSKDDCRITPIGRFLRRTKLDELPELWNVLVGDMSIVGPRPEVPRYVEHYSPEWERVFDVRPGITDLATLQFRDEELVLKHAHDREQIYLQVVVPIKMRLALEYINRRSFMLDLKIILLTLWGITFGRLVGRPEDILAKDAIEQIRSLNSR
ncbi:sugar transferase [Candidatus Woesearchaeota archaeon]|nr:MAG: sugar transferase [Candidatus Woesearchaeota archaeon]